MPIPSGYHIGYRGWLEKDEDGNGNGKKSKGGKTNGNGNSHSNGSHSGNGNGNGGNGGVSEATTLPRVNGQTMYVTFQWRGKYMSLQMFFPEMKVPSKKDVQAAVVKVYPGARVMNYDVVLRDPTKPILQLPEDTNPPADTPDKEPNKDQKEKELKNKERRLSMIKRMVLLKKMQAVRQGGGSDIIA